MKSIQQKAIALILICISSFFPSELLLAKSSISIDHQPPILESPVEVHRTDIIETVQVDDADIIYLRTERARSSRMRHAVRAGAKIGAIIGFVIGVVTIIAHVIPVLTIPVLPMAIPLYILGALCSLGVFTAWHAACGAVTGAIIMKVANRSIEKEKQALQMGN